MDIALTETFTPHDPYLDDPVTRGACHDVPRVVMVRTGSLYVYRCFVGTLLIHLYRYSFALWRGLNRQDFIVQVKPEFEEEEIP